MNMSSRSLKTDGQTTLNLVVPIRYAVKGLMNMDHSQFIFNELTSVAK